MLLECQLSEHHIHLYKQEKQVCSYDYTSTVQLHVQLSHES